MSFAKSNEGPTLADLTRRLSECPPDFLLEPKMKGRGAIDVAAVVADLLRDWGDPISSGEAAPFIPSGEADRQRCRLLLVVAWLLHDDWFLRRLELSSKAYHLLTYDLAELAGLVTPEGFLSDPDRREELVRYCLNALGLVPFGESPTQAQDRLTSLSSVYREQVLRQSRGVQARVQEIRQELQRKAAEAAASKVTRE